MAEARSRYPVEPDEEKRNILFLGDDGVGKTSFINNYCDYMRTFYRVETYIGEYLVFTQFLHYHRYGQKHYQMRILDLPERLTSHHRRDQYPHQAHCVVLCFSIIEPNSLSNIMRLWIPEFRRHLSHLTWMYLIGMKYDRRALMNFRNQNPVNEERGHQVWEEYKCKGDGYMESSITFKPDDARRFMERILNDSFLHPAEPPLIDPHVYADLGYYEGRI